MTRTRLIIAMIVGLMTLSGCYHTTTRHHDAYTTTNTMDYADSSFYSTHHYAPNYNFVVKSDTLSLLRQQPEEKLNGLHTDSFLVKKGDHLVVVDIRLLKDDPADSVWIQLARDQYTFGWIHESRLMPSVVPDDPISQFISTFSDKHLLVFLIIISVIAISYLTYSIKQRHVKAVHFNDINSFYPTLLALTVAMAATFYSSIQLFAPDVWRHFYFHPSLNPFSLPPILAIFIASVWAMIVMAIATIDDVYHKLPFAHATLYMCGLGAVCAANYIIFSVSTLYYIGYVLLVAYMAIAIRRYAKNNYYPYVCGNCGARLRHKGVCDNCGAINS